MTFKPHEIDFLSRPTSAGWPPSSPTAPRRTVPSASRFNERLGTIDIAGYQMSKSRKFRNLARNDKVAFVVDDIPSRDPWRVRCLEIRGTAEQAEIAPAHGRGR